MLLNQPSALLSLALFHSMFACVIPVAPEFKDPLAASNSPPAIISADPDFGRVVSVAPSLTFRISVVDLNVNDALYVRWVVDYPPFRPATSAYPVEYFPHPATGVVHSESPSHTLDCSSGFGAVTTPQQFAVFVADRPLQLNSVENNEHLDLTETGGYVASGSWTVVFQCPPLTSGTQ
ncbi:MAG: hypothetical protein ABUS79_15100 [Pseudomonadota bacterium]